MATEHDILERAALLALQLARGFELRATVAVALPQYVSCQQLGAELKALAGGSFDPRRPYGYWLPGVDTQAEPSSVWLLPRMGQAAGRRINVLIRVDLEAPLWGLEGFRWLNACVVPRLVRGGAQWVVDSRSEQRI